MLEYLATHAYDVTMAGFELVAAALQFTNVRRLYRDKKLAGVNWWVTVFYILWGVWNIALYPHLGFWCSFFAGLLITVANTWWTVLAVHYERRAVKQPCPHGHGDWDNCPVCCH